MAVVCAVAVAGCSGGDAAPATAGCAPSPFRNTPPLVIAHAGGEGLAPANSLLAMELWMSSDGRGGTSQTWRAMSGRRV